MIRETSCGSADNTILSNKHAILCSMLVVINCKKTQNHLEHMLYLKLKVSKYLNKLKTNQYYGRNPRSLFVQFFVTAARPSFS